MGDFLAAVDVVEQGACGGLSGLAKLVELDEVVGEDGDEAVVHLQDLQVEVGEGGGFPAGEPGEKAGPTLAGFYGGE